MIKIESMVGIINGPQVRLKWGAEEGWLTPSEARHHAQALLEAAEAAEVDGFLFHFMKNTVGLEDAKAAAIIHDFRRYRLTKENLNSTGFLTAEQRGE